MTYYIMPVNKLCQWQNKIGTVVYFKNRFELRKCCFKNMHIRLKKRFEKKNYH